MTKTELKQAVEVAKSNADLKSEIDNIHIFNGFALSNFNPITVTVEQVAALVRWQCFQFDGGIDAEALNEIATCGKKKFIVC